MARRIVGNIAIGLFDAVVRPDRFVEATGVRTVESWLELVREFRELVAVYVVNLLLYAIPLTLAGFGRSQVPSVPEAVLQAGIGDEVWTFTYGLIQNSLFISVAAGLTLVAFHIAVSITRQSNGVLPSAYSVVYSTSAYLAGVFTAVWYLSTAAGLEAARRLVIDLQKTYIYAVIDLFSADVGLPGGRPGELGVGALSPAGTTVLSVLLVLAAYFLYSLYLAARINHGTGRINAALVVAAIVATPALYVVGSVLITTTS